MKARCTFFLLALIPTFLFSLDSREGDLYGLWYDNYTDTKIEIKHSRKGIKVKEHNGWFRKWRTYNYMGRGLYDDCDGRVIAVVGHNRIEWRKRRRGRPIILTRYDLYGYNNYQDYNWRPDYYDPRSSNRGYSNRDYPYNRYGRDQYRGDWYCNDHGLSLTIDLSGNGFRARSRGRTSYYQPYDDHYRDRRGNRYYFNNGDLMWQSSDGRRKLKFSKR